MTTVAGWVLLLPATGLATLWWWLTPSRPSPDCHAPGCPAGRYAPLDEHLITAHHQHDNQKART